MYGSVVRPSVATTPAQQRAICVADACYCEQDTPKRPAGNSEISGHEGSGVHPDMINLRGEIATVRLRKAWATLIYCLFRNLPSAPDGINS